MFWGSGCSILWTACASSTMEHSGAHSSLLLFCTSLPLLSEAQLGFVSCWAKTSFWSTFSEAQCVSQAPPQRLCGRGSSSTKKSLSCVAGLVLSLPQVPFHVGNPSAVSTPLSMKAAPGCHRTICSTSPSPVAIMDLKADGLCAVLLAKMAKRLCSSCFKSF